MTPLATIPGNYTVLNSDNNGSLRAGGGSCSTITYGTPSGYDDGHSTWLTNLDTNCCKWVVLTSGTGFEQPVRLWPHQKIFVEKTIDKWSWSKPPRYKLWDSSYVIKVDANYGVDSTADGISAPFQTPGWALTTICDELDLFFNAAPQITVQLADAVNTLYDGIHFPGGPVSKAGNASIMVQGNAADPTKTQIGPNGAAGPICMFDHALLQLQNLMIAPQGDTGISLASGSQCWIMGNVLFGDAGSTGSDMLIQDDSIMFVNGSYSKTGNAGFHVTTQHGGRYIPKGNFTVNFESDCHFNTLSLAQGASQQSWGSMSFNDNGHSVTGRKWYMDTNAGILTGGVNRDTFFLGNSNGATGPGNPYGDY